MFAVNRVMISDIVSGLTASGFVNLGTDQRGAPVQ